MTLYSYCLLYDSGAAPNPYWNICTLVICKPQIRRVAKVGDWVVGLGSKNSELGNISNKVIYAMKITQKLTMQEYDRYCLSKLTGKIPDWQSNDYRKRVGDCIYDYSLSKKYPLQREGVHDETNSDTDLKGEYALLSNHFWYFGKNPELLPNNLLNISHSSPGHKSKANTSFTTQFVHWIESKKKIIGEPELKSKLMDKQDCRGACAYIDKVGNENDEIEVENR